jgi:shikimate kinase
MAQPANLVLIGPTGAGKTSVGRLLARRLGWRFVDVDGEIEASSGVSIPLIFELEGEPGFREREHRVLATVCAGSGQVIATGAGAVLREDNRRLIKAAGWVVLLSATIDQQLQRLERDGSRPLLAGGQRRRRLEQLAEEREPIYRALADLVVQTGDGPPRRVCANVLAALAERGIEPAA